ncbi:MAG: LLM class flavin-dependent oxidoreductase [Candidatus Nezhaarchaeales archaeon]
MLRFGINPSPHPWSDVSKFADWCITVEDLGFDSIVIPDHYELPVPPFPSNELVDCWTTLAYVAAKTNKIRLGSIVNPIPRWIPSQLAKVIANVDYLSKGRVIAGFGIGFYEGEFVNYSPQAKLEDVDTRLERFVEGLELILKLWTEYNVNFEGKYYKLRNAILLPKPIQRPHPPLWSGGLGKRALMLTAKYFDGWFPHSVPPPSPHGVRSPEDYEMRVKIIKEYMKKYGRDPSQFTFGYLLMIGLIIRDFSECVDVIESYQKAGCQYFIIEFVPTPPPEKYIDMTKKFASEVMSSFV